VNLTRPLPKLVAVVALQIVILLSILAFKQYTAWTAETVLLRAETTAPRELAEDQFTTVQYEISTINIGELPGDEDFFDSVYVELQERNDGTWGPMAAHDNNDRDFSGTVNIKGEIVYMSGRYGRSQIELRYDIEDVYVPADEADELPAGDGHTIVVEAKVDRFGNADPQHFLIDGERFELEER
jgi:uncharacterized membrane-anchored protein